MSTDKPWSYDTNSLTLQRYLLAEQSLYPKASGELTKLITSLLIGFKSISSVVRRNGFLNLHDITAKTNQVEEAKNLDVLSNEILINIITSSLACGGMISQKDDAVVKVDEIKTGNYILCFDPLNGSSDIDCMLPMASIFGIWRKRTEGMTPATKEDFIQPGRWLVAAGYCIYGSATMVIISTGSGVDGFTLDA
ncbi:fructose-1,6-bisphosphatase, partial [Cooperia oncophora]